MKNCLLLVVLFTAGLTASASASTLTITADPASPTAGSKVKLTYSGVLDAPADGDDRAVATIYGYADPEGTTCAATDEEESALVDSRLVDTFSPGLGAFSLTGEVELEDPGTYQFCAYLLDYSLPGDNKLAATAALQVTVVKPVSEACLQASRSVEANVKSLKDAKKRVQQAKGPARRAAAKLTVAEIELKLSKARLRAERCDLASLES